MPYSQNTWNSQIYNYAEHLYWTPWELKKSPNLTYPEIFNNLKNREVPLNIIFNIFLDISSSKLKHKIINSFFVSNLTQPNHEDFINFIDSKILYEKLDKFEFTQPDVILESESSRYLIELKLKSAQLSLKQIYKYLFLHGLWQNKTNSRKTPYLLLITENNLAKQWISQERNVIFTGQEELTDLYKYIINHDLPKQFGKDGLMIHLHDEVKQVMNQLRLGWITWQSLGNLLHQELEALNKTNLNEGEEVIKRLINGFLNELSYRQLWQ